MGTSNNLVVTDEGKREKLKSNVGGTDEKNVVNMVVSTVVKKMVLVQICGGVSIFYSNLCSF